MVNATRQRAGRPGVGLASFQPLAECPPSLIGHLSPTRLRFGDLRLGRDHRGFLLVIGQQQGGRRYRTGEVGVDAGFVDVVEEGEELVVLLLGNRIELVLVTTSTFERQSQECHREGVIAIGDVFDTELLGSTATLDLLGMQAIEGRCQLGVPGRFRDQVTGQLPRDKLVVGHVRIEGPHDPVAIWPDVTIPIDLVSVGIGVAGDVEPFRCHPFSESR